MKHFIPSQTISYDEAMIKCFGRRSCPQAIRNELIWFGYKVWCQNNSDEYLVAFDMYQSKTYQGNEKTAQKLGKAPATVKHLFGKYGVKHNYPYHVFMDNLSTIVPLLEELEMNGYLGTGAVRVNRLGKSFTLADAATFKHLNRRSMRSVQTILLH